MDYEDRVIRIENIDYLQEPTSLSPAPDQKLVVPNLLREWRLGLSDNHFCFFAAHAMFRYVVPIPFNPSKQHDLLPDSLEPLRIMPLSPRWSDLCLFRKNLASGRLPTGADPFPRQSKDYCRILLRPFLPS
jgi:hypothetical protein